MSARDSSEVVYLPIPGFDKYEVGSDGSVWSCYQRNKSQRQSEVRRGKLWLQLKPWKTRTGYMYVRLWHPGKYTTGWVHRLVLTAFVGPCPHGMNGAHNNGDPTDNRLSNLRWATHADNCADKKLHGTSQHGSHHPMAKLSEADIPRIFDLLNKGMYNKEIAASIGVAEPTIQAVRAGRLWSHVHRPPIRLASNDNQKKLIGKIASLGYSQRAIGELIGLCQQTINCVLTRSTTMRLRHELALELEVNRLTKSCG